MMRIHLPKYLQRISQTFTPPSLTSLYSRNVLVGIFLIVVILPALLLYKGVAFADEVNFSEFAADGAGNWCEDPRAIRVNGAHDKTYTGWVTSTGDVVASSYDHDTQVQQTFTLHPSLQVDDHVNPTFLELPDKRIMAFYSSHSGPSLFYRKTTNPEDITSWGPEQNVPTNAPGGTGYTYPSPMMLSAEGNKIYLFWRGGSWQPTFSSSTDNGDTWAPYKLLINNSPQRPYVKYVSNGVDTIYFAYTEGHPRNVFNSIFFGYYKNGAVYKADGTLIKNVSDLPMAPSEGDKVYDANVGGAKAWGWDIALDQTGNPIITYATFPTDLDHEYWYARWDGESWQNHHITNGGKYIDGPQEPNYSGGVTLDHNDPSTVFLSKEIGGIHEIQKWTTPDEGSTWTSVSITSNSTEKNIRPFTVWGYPGSGEMQALWYTGRYTSYTDYDLAVNTYPALPGAPTPTPNPNPVTTFMEPDADTYVRNGNYANSNFGTQTILATKDDANSYRRESFLKFDLNSFSGDISSAKLRLYASSAGSAPNISNSIATVADSSWTETGINWNNQPASSPNFSSWQPVAGNWAEIDVTSQIQDAINANKLASFRVSSTSYVGSEGYTYYSSKEHITSSLRPQLEVTTGAGSPTPMPTPAPTGTYLPEADTFVRDGNYANTNFGSADTMGTKYDATSYRRESFVRFNLSGYSGAVTNAKIRLYVDSTGIATNILNSIGTVASSTWSESGINWNNKPASSSSFFDWHPVTGQWVEIDVTSQVQAALLGNSFASFRLYSTGYVGSEGMAFYATKENSNSTHRPELIITQ